MLGHMGSREEAGSKTERKTGAQQMIRAQFDLKLAIIPELLCYLSQYFFLFGVCFYD
jgi:hypothetical protein